MVGGKLDRFDATQHKFSRWKRWKHAARRSVVIHRRRREVAHRRGTRTGPLSTRWRISTRWSITMRRSIATRRSITTRWSIATRRSITTRRSISVRRSVAHAAALAHAFPRALAALCVWCSLPREFRGKDNVALGVDPEFDVIWSACGFDARCHDVHRSTKFGGAFVACTCGNRDVRALHEAKQGIHAFDRNPTRSVARWILNPARPEFTRIKRAHGAVDRALPRPVDA